MICVQRVAMSKYKASSGDQLKSNLAASPSSIPAWIIAIVMTSMFSVRRIRAWGATALPKRPMLGLRENLVERARVVVCRFVFSNICGIVTVVCRGCIQYVCQTSRWTEVETDETTALHRQTNNLLGATTIVEPNTTSEAEGIGKFARARSNSLSFSVSGTHRGYKFSDNFERSKRTRQVVRNSNKVLYHRFWGCDAVDCKSTFQRMRRHAATRRCFEQDDNRKRSLAAFQSSQRAGLLVISSVRRARRGSSVETSGEHYCFPTQTESCCRCVGRQGFAICRRGFGSRLQL